MRDSGNSRPLIPMDASGGSAVGAGHTHAGASFARDFSRHFGGAKAPSPPPPPPAPPPPPQDNTAAMQAAADERTRQRAKRGRASTVLTAGVAPGDLQSPPTMQPTLLGGGR